MAITLAEAKVGMADKVDQQIIDMIPAQLPAAGPDDFR